MLLKGNQISSRNSSFLFILLAVLLGVAAGALVISVGRPVYILVGLAGLIGFVATLVSVEFGLLMLVFLTYTRFSDIAVANYNAPSVAKMFIVLLVVAILIRWALANERPTGLFLPMVMVAAYGLVGFASLLYAPNKEAVVYSLSNYVKDALIALVVVALLKKPEQFRHVIYTLLVVGVFIGSLSVHQYLTRNFNSDYGGFAEAEFMNIVNETNDYRLVGPVGDANFFAQVMVVLALLGVERFVHDKKLPAKLLAGLCAAVSILTVVFTFSRSATVALVISLIIFFWIYRLKPSQLMVVLLIGVVMFLYAPATYFERVLSLRDVLPGNGHVDLTSDRAIQGRASQSLTAWVMVMEKPLLGVGLNNYTTLYQEYAKSLGLAPSATARSPHNLYLEVAAETGMLGLAVFLLLVGLAFRAILYTRAKFHEAGLDDYSHLVTGFAVAFGGYMFTAVFAHAAYPRYFYLLLGLAYALPKLIEQLQIDADDQLMKSEELAPHDVT